MEDLTDFEVINKVFEYLEILLKKIQKMMFKMLELGKSLYFNRIPQLVISKQRDTYFATENLEVTEIEGMEGVEDCKVLAPELVKHCYEIRFKESHPPLNHRGDENWKVRCKCGATVDDGHRMIACDFCGVWHHQV
ncbi:hypothetical protein RHGRI_030397 [Rhododendron griersonianum]|uniref:Uncharacterized protein n=1 Tax=Rhododendron griersonianum TaxID=479676 RepID=A0AAV6INF4_9ERIC|nr:hypothetical protein RHGRI_030397 [Rhododendron griersonianum]